MHVSNICFVRCNIVEIEATRIPQNMGTTVFDVGGAAISSNYKSDIHVVQKVVQRYFTCCLRCTLFITTFLVYRLIIDDNVGSHCTLT
jgi:hypothetical protein